MGITCPQALDCFLSDDLIGIGMEADALRRQQHPEGVATYVVQAAICVSVSEFERNVEEAVERGATGFTLLGTLPGLAEWRKLLDNLRNRFPSVWRDGLSASAVLALAASSGAGVDSVLRGLQDSGLQSLSGGDAGMLPLHDPVHCGMEDWLRVHRAAHRIGLPSAATMLFGAGETMEHRIAHLDALRGLQSETGGFTSFYPQAAPLPNFEEATAVEYLKTLAISRMFLDNIPHVLADRNAQGLKVLQMALRFGADDVGSTMPLLSDSHDNVTEEDLRRIIRGAGLRPVERDPSFRTRFIG